MNIKIEKYQTKYKNELLNVWEKSVLATHGFLKDHDFISIRKMLREMDFETLTVFCLINESNVIGFIGLDKTKIEMLFLDPDHIGKGLGKQLIEFALLNFNADSVDVNEQNVHAVEFYKKLGFETFERTEKDNSGKRYPLLKMRLTNRNKNKKII
ncbi:MAG: GNAT family N-acetyltransferase [Planctomycetaceae bacterium]|jgi:putative acetyltransferase|nr:GNAT family N-acetyltransferase [Planctomycetaceae bacterium]